MKQTPLQALKAKIASELEKGKTYKQMAADIGCSYTYFNFVRYGSRPITRIIMDWVYGAGKWKKITTYKVRK